MKMAYAELVSQRKTTAQGAIKGPPKATDLPTPAVEMQPAPSDVEAPPAKAAAAPTVMGDTKALLGPTA
jgi:hypothetical protein